MLYIKLSVIGSEVLEKKSFKGCFYISNGGHIGWRIQNIFANLKAIVASTLHMQFETHLFRSYGEEVV